MLSWDERVGIAQSTVARFSGRPLDWGKVDCVKMAAHVLREAGHTVPLARGGSYSTHVGALRALRRAGYGSLMEAVEDRGLASIAPAARWPADLVALPAEPPFDVALYVSLTNGRLLGVRDGMMTIVQPHQFTAAWRL